MNDLVKRLPDCMMPDGAEPCAGYQELMREMLDDLREWGGASTTIYDERTFSEMIDAYAKERGCE